MSTFSITHLTKGKGMVDKKIQAIVHEAKSTCENLLSFKILLENALKEWAASHPMRSRHYNNIFIKGDTWHKITVEYSTIIKGQLERKVLLVASIN